MPQLIPVLAALALAACSTPPSSETLATAGQTGLTEFPSAGMAIIRIEGGEVASVAYVGEAAPGRSVDAETLFNVASITKIVTAELAHTLAAQGRLDLDASIADYVSHPDLASDPRFQDLTPRLILSHQTGLLNWAHVYEDETLAFTFDPGEGYSYSGAAFELLSDYMAATQGEAFEVLVDRHVFAPMGVEAYLGADAAPQAVRVRPMDAEGEFQDFRPRDREPNAADNMFISADNLARFLITTLDRETAEDAPRTTPLTDISASQACGLEDQTNCPAINAVSLGWSLTFFDDARYAYHGGSDWAENAIAFMDIDTGEGYVAMVNGGRGLGAWITALSVLEPDHKLVRFAAAIPEVEAWMYQTRAEP